VCFGVSGFAGRQVLVQVQEPEPVQQARVRVLGLGLVQVQGLVPAQGPQVRPGLQVLRLVAVVLAFFSLSFVFMCDSRHSFFPHRRIVWSRSLNSSGEYVLFWL